MTLPRLILVDDEERILCQLQAYLGDFDEFRIRCLTSAEEALETLEQEHADVCVVDMRLPGISGEAFILEAHGRGLCRRFILHTGSLDLALSAQLREVGLTDADLFYKPTDMNQLLGRIHILLQTQGE